MSAPEFENTKDEDEEILWTGKPNLMLHIFITLIKSVPLLLLSLIFIFSSIPPSRFGLLLGLSLLLLVMLFFFYSFFSFASVVYGCSNKGLMVRKSFLVKDIQVIHHYKITDIEVKANIIEKIFGVGSIYFFNGNIQNHEYEIKRLPYDVWRLVKKPNEVAKIIEQASIRMRADFSPANRIDLTKKDISLTFAKDLLPEFYQFKATDEEILWIGKPHLTSYLSKDSTLFAIDFFCIIVLYYSISFEPPSGFITFLLLFIIAPFLYKLFIFLSAFLFFKKTVYAYSNKRIIIKMKSIQGTKIEIINYDQISDMKINIGFVERIYNVGTVSFFSGKLEEDERSEKKVKKLYDHFTAIETPYEVFKFIKQNSFSVKDDFKRPQIHRLNRD